MVLRKSTQILIKSDEVLRNKIVVKYMQNSIVIKLELLSLLYRQNACPIKSC